MKTLNKIKSVLGKRNTLKFSGVFILLLILAILEAFGVGAIFPLVASISDPELVGNSKPGRFFIAYLGLPNSTTLLPYICVLVFVLFVAKNLTLMLTTYIQAKVINQQRADLSGRMFAHYMSISYDLFVTKKIAEMMNYSCGLINQFVMVFCMAWLKIVAESFIVITIFILLVIINFKIALFVLAISLIIGLIYTQLTKKHLVRLGEKGQEATVGFYQVIHEGLSGVKEVKVLEAESFFMRLFKNFTDKYKKNITHVAVWQIAPKIMIETLIVTMVTGFILFAYRGNQDIAEILPLLGVFGVAFMRLYPSFNAILSSISSISAQQFSLDILYDELKEADHKTTQTVRDTQEAALTYKHSLELKGLHYRYPGSALPTLKDINLTISPGESIAIVGKSGSGKTTLADVILGLLHCESGEILLDGINVFQEISKWHGMLGYIPQHIFLLNDTIQQNITFGVHEEDIDHEALNNAIISAQLQELIEELPKGVLTVVGERGVRLSGGQRQRIGIARALYRNPKILVLDEATSALDNETEAAISKAIETISHDKTLIIIAHRLSTVKNCDRLYLVDNGKIVSHGSYQELINKNEWFKKVNDLAATQ